jgi:nucleoside-diphosphate-sugar epimerase
MTGRLFIFGLGFSGLEIARAAKAQGWTVAGTCTTADKVERLGAKGIEAHLFDGTHPLSDAIAADNAHVLCTIAPGTTGDPAINHCARLLRRARWLGYLSTTGVYGDHDGGWVDEATPTRPRLARSIARLAAERAWQAVALEAGLPLDIFRLPGIYGPGRSTLDQVKAGTARRIDKPGQVFSRVHVADIAGTVLAALSRPHEAGPYNVADDLPTPTGEVVAFACELLSKPVPPAIPWEKIEPTLSAMARSFYAENRRVRNDRIKAALGVALRYPTYREGLRAIAAADLRPSQ